MEGHRKLLRLSSQGALELLEVSEVESVERIIKNIPLGPKLEVQSSSLLQRLRPALLAQAICEQQLDKQTWKSFVQ